MLDSTVVNIALERIGAEFDASFASLQWTVNGYTLTLAGLILLGGSLGDRLGRRRIFLVGVVWFAVASALCGLAPSVEFLIAGRALQGIGGALLTPGSLALISASFHGGDRAAAIGAWSGLGGVAGAVGPFLGGWLVEWTWRAVFLINLPLAAVVVVVALRHVPESRDPQAARHLDVPGTVLAVTGLAALTFALTAAGEGGATVPAIVAGAAGALALVAFVVVERRSRAPLVPGELFANPRFTGANVITLLVYGALGVHFLLVVLQLQVVAGFSPLAAGTAILPITLIMLLLSARSGRLAQRIGPRWPMTVGLLLAATAMLLLRRIGPGRVVPRRRGPGGRAVRAGARGHRRPAHRDRPRRRRRPARRDRLGGQQRHRPGRGPARRRTDPGAGRHLRAGLHRPAVLRRGLPHRDGDLCGPARRRCGPLGGPVPPAAVTGTEGSGPLRHRVLHALRGQRPAAVPPLNRRSRRLLATTKTLENAMAAPAMTGLSRPSAASGSAATL
jgi:MFS family permease